VLAGGPGTVVAVVVAGGGSLPAWRIDFPELHAASSRHAIPAIDPLHLTP
jgi:hypothetical protein